MVSNSGAALKIKMSREANRMTNIWQKNVNVCAADSAEKTYDITYVKGIIPNGKASKM